MIVLVTYDLKDSDKDYKPFYDALKKQGRWWHYMTSTWLLDTGLEPEAIVDAIRPLMSESDNLFVTEITKNNNSQLSQKAWDWLKRHQS